jgi:hypothetical protein
VRAEIDPAHDELERDHHARATLRAVERGEHGLSTPADADATPTVRLARQTSGACT